MRYIALILMIPLAFAAQMVQSGVNTKTGRGGTTVAQTPPPPPTPTADLATVEGQVFNAIGGTPLRKATITINRQNSGPMAPGARGNYSASTDASGRFSITGIEPGIYRLNASHTGFLDMSYNARRPGGNGTPLDLGRAQKMTNVILKLTPHSVVSGKITDEDSDPLEGVQVQIMRLAYNQGKKQLQQSGNESTNDLGEFRLAGIVPGKYFLCAVYRGRRGMMMGADNDQPQEDYVTTFFPGVTDLAAAAPIEVGPGDQMQGLNIRLHKIHTVRVKGRAVNNAVAAPPAAPAARQALTTISVANGQLQDAIANLQAAVGNQVMVGNPGIQVRMQPRSALSPNGLNINAPVKPDGTFEFASVAPGAYTLVAMTMGGRGHAVKQALDVGNANIEGITLAINPGAMVTGHVRFDGDAPQPAPVLNVRLVAREPLPGVAAPQAAKVDPDGSFRFDDVIPDNYNVTINTPQGFYLKSVRAGSSDAMVAGIDLTNGAGSLEIVLGTNPPQVGGSVLNSTTQQPAAAVTVVLMPQEKERQGQSYFYSSTNTDQYGNFTFSRVTPGEYKVYAWEDVQNGLWYDPDFMKAYEGKGESVSAKEGSPVNVKLTMIPAK